MLQALPKCVSVCIVMNISLPRGSRGKDFNEFLVVFCYTKWIARNQQLIFLNTKITHVFYLQP